MLATNCILFAAAVAMDGTQGGSVLAVYWNKLTCFCFSYCHHCSVRVVCERFIFSVSSRGKCSLRMGETAPLHVIKVYGGVDVWVVILNLGILRRSASPSIRPGKSPSVRVEKEGGGHVEPVWTLP